MGTNGLLTDVRWEWTGTEVTADLLTGVTVLPVLDPESITADENVWIAGTGSYRITDVDVDASTFTITPGLLLDIDRGTEVAKDIGGQPGRAWVAEVILPDAERPVEVPLTIHDLAVMPEGTYNPPVAIVLSDDLDSVENLPGSLPIVDGSYLLPDSVPLPPSSDGNPPPLSPQPEVISGIGAFYLRWTPPVNNDPMRFEVHVSPDSGFTPDADTLYSETSSYSVAVRNLATIDPNTGLPVPFDYDQTYYFKIVAKDDDDAAAPSVETSGVLTKIVGPDIAANTIVGENIVGNTITGDKFAGQVVMGSTISTGIVDDDGNIVGARVDLGPAGLRVVDSAGQDVFSVPLDSLESAKMRANFEMLSAQVLDNFTLYGLSNRIATGSALFLASGVSAPAGTPTVSHVYDTIQFDTTTAVSPQNTAFGNLGKIKLNPAQINSIAWNTVWNVYEVCQQTSGGFRIWHFDATTGAIFTNIATGKPWVDDYDDRQYCTNSFGNGATAATQGGAVLFKSGGVWYFWGPTEINRIPGSWILDIDSRPPVLGFDAINDKWFIAQSDGGASGTFHARRFNVIHYSGSGAFPNATNSSTYTGEAGSGWGKRPNGTYYGTGGGSFAGNRFVFTTEDYSGFLVLGNAGVVQDDDGIFEMWYSPAAKQGFCWTGTEFASVDATGKVTKYTNWTWTAASAQAWIGLTAYDSDTAGVSSGTSAPHSGQTAGQHETPVGTILSFSAQRRAKLQITFPKTQDSGGVDDPDKWKAYWARNPVKPATGSAMKYAGQAGSPTTTSSITLTADPTGAAPPGGISNTVGAVNNFPAGTPSLLASQATDGLGELIQLKGDGSWRLGHLSGTAAGTDANDTGWVALTLTNGYTNYGGVYVTAACRRIGNRVFLRGLPNSGSKGTSIATLPVGFRPAFQMMVPVVVQTISIDATGDGAKSTGNPDDNVTTGASAGTAHTHNMKNHQHPISAYDISSSMSNGVGRLTLFTDGTMSADTGAMAESSWVSLFGVSFLLD